MWKADQVMEDWLWWDDDIVTRKKGEKGKSEQAGKE